MIGLYKKTIQLGLSGNLETINTKFKSSRKKKINHLEKELSIYTNLFLVSILRKFKVKYSFGRQVTLQRLEKEIIKLPAKQTSNGKSVPDWIFMKSLSYSCYL